MNRWIAALALAAAAGAACALTAIAVRIGTPAYYVPPARIVVLQQVRDEGAWNTGHWEWQGDGHVWVPGRSIAPRRIARVTDVDGMHDRFDRAPYNPYRY